MISTRFLYQRSLHKWPYKFIIKTRSSVVRPRNPVKGTVHCLRSRLSFLRHMILLDPKKIPQFIVDVTNARDKECHVDITKVSITGKAILTESKLESVQNSTWLFMAQNNSVYGFRVRILCKHYYVYKQINSNGFINNALSL